MSIKSVNNSNRFNTEQNYNISKTIKLTYKKVNNFISKFQNDFWIYFKSSVLTTKGALKIVAVKIPRFEPKILKALGVLGLSAAISVSLTIAKYPSNIKNFIDNLSINDIEGVVLSGISLVISPLDAMDSFISLTTSASTLGLIPVVTIFGMIALPIAITLLGYVSIRGIYDSIHLGIQQHQIPKEVTTNAQIEALKIDLENKLRVTTSEKNKIKSESNGNQKKIERKFEVLESRKLNKLKRHTDVKIVILMSYLLKGIEQGTVNTTTINNSLSDIHTLLNRKIKVGVSGTISSIALLTALSAIVITPISPLAIPAILLIRGAISLGKHYYMQALYTKGLHNQANIA